ncbi:MAG: hypothetical protein ACFFBD_30300, partial [Candidatus Hodarchaeota archaeon]
MLVAKHCNVFTGYYPFIGIGCSWELGENYEDFRRAARFVSQFPKIGVELKKRTLISFMIRDPFPSWSTGKVPTHLLFSLFWSNVHNRVERDSEFLELYKEDLEWLENIPSTLEEKEVMFEFLFRAKKVLEALNEKYFLIIHIHSSSLSCRTILHDLLVTLEQPSIGVIFSSFWGRKEDSTRETLEEILVEDSFENEHFINFFTILLRKYQFYLKNEKNRVSGAEMSWELG